MEDKIYKVWLKIEVNGKNMGHQVIDLQFDQGIPYAVLEWHMTHEGEIPFALESICYIPLLTLQL